MRHATDAQSRERKPREHQEAVCREYSGHIDGMHLKPFVHSDACCGQTALRYHRVLAELHQGQSTVAWDQTRAAHPTVFHIREVSGRESSIPFHVCGDHKIKGIIC